MFNLGIPKTVFSGEMPPAAPVPDGALIFRACLHNSFEFAPS